MLVKCDERTKVRMEKRELRRGSDKTTPPINRPTDWLTNRLTDYIKRTLDRVYDLQSEWDSKWAAGPASSASSISAAFRETFHSLSGYRHRGLTGAAPHRWVLSVRALSLGFGLLFPNPASSIHQPPILLYSHFTAAPPASGTSLSPPPRTKDPLTPQNQSLAQWGPACSRMGPIKSLARFP